MILQDKMTQYIKEQILNLEHQIGIPSIQVEISLDELSFLDLYSYHNQLKDELEQLRREAE